MGESTKCSPPGAGAFHPFETQSRRAGPTQAFCSGKRIQYRAGWVKPLGDFFTGCGGWLKFSESGREKSILILHWCLWRTTRSFNEGGGTRIKIVHVPPPLFAQRLTVCSNRFACFTRFPIELGFSCSPILLFIIIFIYSYILIPPHVALWM